MFEREHHRAVGLVLQALDPVVLARHQCWFGGGTAMALLHGEYRESVDIDFLVANRSSYRDLRQMLGGSSSLAPLVRSGLAVQVVRELRADQYGIRTQVRSGTALIKFEIVLEARIGFEEPGPDDQVCGIRTLAPVDLAAEKLLANADRWPDDGVFSRDLIDLAMQRASRAVLQAARSKAESAYGDAVRKALAAAVDGLRKRPHRLEECMRALSITGVSKAQLWARIRALSKALPA